MDGDDDQGHDDQIAKIKDREQLLKNKEAHLKGQYEYVKPMSEN